MGTLLELFTTTFCFVLLLENVLASTADDKCNEYINLARNKRSVGGIDTTPAEFPHMAVLLFGDKGFVGCAGSLISDQYILTVGICADNNLHGRPTKVRLGDRNIKSAEDDANVQEIQVDSVISHADYRTTSFYNDISLIKLKNKVNFTKFVRPACLNTKENFESDSVMATGWGVTEYLGQLSDVLQKVKLDVFTNEECNNTLGNPPTRKLPRGIIASQMCAGSRTDSKGTCMGDSGGPYQILKDGYTDVYTIVGIISFGKECGTVNVPEGGTRVSSFIPWIENIVWK